MESRDIVFGLAFGIGGLIGSLVVLPLFRRWFDSIAVRIGIAIGVIPDRDEERAEFWAELSKERAFSNFLGREWLRTVCAFESYLHGLELEDWEKDIIERARNKRPEDMVECLHPSLEPFYLRNEAPVPKRSVERALFNRRWRPIRDADRGFDTCPKCGSDEVPSNGPRTTYACGSSDYDQRPSTFRCGTNCIGGAPDGADR